VKKMKKKFGTMVGAMQKYHTLGTPGVGVI
jgi:hypothetical protein